MGHYVEFSLPDGSTIIMESDEWETAQPLAEAATEEGVIEAGLKDEIKKHLAPVVKPSSIERARQTFEQAAENARKSALVILDKVRSGLHDAPDSVEITFGLKASGELGSMVVAKTGIEASYSVKLTWNKAEEKSHARPRGLRPSHLR